MIKSLLIIIGGFVLIVVDMIVYEKVGELMTTPDTFNVVLGGVLGIAVISFNFYIIKLIIKKHFTRKGKQDETENA